MEPIRPEQVVDTKMKLVPTTVIKVFNDLISQNFSEGRAIVKQDHVVALLIADGLTNSDIFANRWLDIEDMYRKYGWEVEYDKPGYNEGYPATFTFTKRKNQ